MILIADGGSTKADWIALDNDSNEVFRSSDFRLESSSCSSKRVSESNHKHVPVDGH